MLKLRGPRCRCRKHRAVSLGIHTDQANGVMTAAAYWNNFQVSPEFEGPRSFSDALAWAKTHLPEEKACVMTEAERRRR